MAAGVGGRASRPRAAWLAGGSLAWLLMLAATAGADDDGLAGRYLTVGGEGKVRARPDLAVATVGVSVTGKTATAAMAESRQRVAALLGELSAAGVAEADVLTADVGIHRQAPPRRADGKPAATPRFEVRNLLQVTIRDLAGVGALIDRLVAAGANDLQGIRFALEDDAQVQRQARALAAADARQKAEQLAQLHDVRLGRVLRISESGVRAVGPGAVMLRTMAEASPTVSPGELTFAAHLQVIYELTD